MSNTIVRSVKVPRANSLGQLDDEFNHGPKPLHPRDIPIDLRERIIRHDKRGQGYGEGGAGYGQGGLGDIDQMAKDIHALASTKILRRGLLGRVEQITSVPKLIVQASEPRAYLLLNPAGTVGLTATGEMFNNVTTAGASVVTSGSVGVANFKTARFFLESTFGAGLGPVTFDLQTLNPVTNNYITAQTLFSVAATPFSGYVDVGTNGIDTDFRIVVTVPIGSTITYNLGYALKDGLEGTSAGVSQTIFFGGAGVSPNSGYPLLSGKEREFYFSESVSLYAVTAGPTLDMNIFEL